MKHWKITVCLLALVAVSVAIGGVLGFNYARRLAQKRFDPTTWHVRAMQGLEKKLKLTPEQKQRVQAQLDAAVKELRVIHNDTVGHASAVINVLLGHIENELSPEQREIFNTMRPKESDMTVDLLKVDPAKK